MPSKQTATGFLTSHSKSALLSQLAEVLWYWKASIAVDRQDLDTAAALLPTCCLLYNNEPDMFTIELATFVIAIKYTKKP